MAANAFAAALIDPDADKYRRDALASTPVAPAALAHQRSIKSSIADARAVSSRGHMPVRQAAAYLQCAHTQSLNVAKPVKDTPRKHG